MNLIEIFTHNAPGKWEQEGDLQFKRFEVECEKYEVRVKVEEIDDEKYGIVTFAWLSPDDKASMDLTNLNKGAAKVVATVVNSVWDRFADLSAFIFSAKDDEKRERFYAKIAAYLAQSHNLRQQVGSLNGGKIFALTKQNSKLRLSDFVGIDGN
jgi:hypothetical protein